MKSTEFITEVFSANSLSKNRYPLEWSGGNSGTIISAKTKTDLGNSIKMEFYSIYDLNYYIVEFTVNDSYNIRGTNERDVIPIFNTIIYGIFRFILKYKPNYLIFSAREKSRLALYTRLVDMFALPLGYEVGSTDELPEELQQYLKGHGQSFVLRRKNRIDT